MTIDIREERPDDLSAIRAVNDRAFGQSQEGRLVDALRAAGAGLLSLVAIVDDRVVGHIMYSPISVGVHTGAALAPMAVLPEYQRRGIGSRLVEEGIRRLKDAGCPFVIVLGHTHFYPRFGFRPARTSGVTSEWDVPDDVFMLLVLDAVKAEGLSGAAKYRSEFSLVS